jgi:hypothetical protein
VNNTIPIREPQDEWRAVNPGEGFILPGGDLVVRINPKSELAQDLRPEERSRMGVVVRTDGGYNAPGSLIVIGDDTPGKKVVWHGPRTRH